MKNAINDMPQLYCQKNGATSAAQYLQGQSNQKLQPLQGGAVAALDGKK